MEPESNGEDSCSVFRVRWQRVNSLLLGSCPCCWPRLGFPSGSEGDLSCVNASAVSERGLWVCLHFLVILLLKVSAEQMWQSFLIKMYVIYLCVRRGVDVCHDKSVAARGQPLGQSSLSLPSLGWNLGPQAWLQVPLPLSHLAWPSPLLLNVNLARDNIFLLYYL